jgi:drug/metabolite transporter (DMT)-like permease
MRTAVFRLVTGAVMISFSGVWVKVSHVTPASSAFYRVLFGGFLLLAAAVWRREVKWPNIRQLALATTGGGFLALDLLFYHSSIFYVGPGLGTILPNFQVFILAAVGILFLGEKLRWSLLTAIALAFSGLFLIVGIDWASLDSSYKVGIYFGLGAAFCYAWFLLSLRKLQAEQAGVSIFFALMAVSFVTALFLAAEIIHSGGTFAIPDLQSLTSLAALGLFSHTLGWVIITNALPHIRASLSGLILLLQPALAFVWDVLLFQRPTSAINWLGVLVVLSAVYLGTVKPTQRARR